MPAANTIDATPPTPGPFVSARPIIQQEQGAVPERIIIWNEQPFLSDKGEPVVPVWIDVRKLEAMLPFAAHMEHVGFAGQNGIMGKYTGVNKFVRSIKRKTVFMPNATIERACKEHLTEILFTFSTVGTVSRGCETMAPRRCRSPS